MKPESADTSPRQVVERIRKRFLLDIDSATEEFKEGARYLQTELNSALELLSKELYSTKSHFVLELIQNADDNHYAPDIKPSLTLRVSPTNLIVENNEVGFIDENVDAICRVGASTKSKQKSGYIGEKGIGFKSVFTVSDAPQIHSNGYHFKFDRTVKGNLLGYVVPHWCEAPKDLNGDVTTVILPAANNYEFGADTFVDLDARLLLFLNKLRQLTLNNNGQSVTFHREDKASVSTLSATRVASGGAPETEEMHYVRVELPLPVTDKFADEKRVGIEGSTLVLAFPVDEAGAAKPEPASHVFAFLPIRPMGFKFSIQADFILSSSREGILTDRPWNQLLRTGIAEAFSSAVEAFKRSPSLALSYLKYIPAEGEVVDPFFRSVRADILKHLAKQPCLLSESGEWKKPSELRTADKSFRALFPSKLALKLFGFDYVDLRTLGGNDLLRSLGAKEVLLADVLSVFGTHGEWLQAQALEWRGKFYAYLANLQQRLIDAGLLTYQCLPISDGTLVVPSQSNVFFPLGRGKKYGFESELVIIDNDLYEEALKHSEHVVALFAAMKVRTDDPYDLVHAHILPRHKDDEWKKSSFKALTGHLRYIKDKQTGYLESAQVKGMSKTQAFDVLRNGMWVGTKNLVDGTWMFSRAQDLYLSKEYGPNFCIESYLGEALEPTKLISPDYLAAKPKDADAEAESWRQFFIQLGVRVAPAVESEGSDWKCSSELRCLLESSNASVRKATLECMSIHWSLYSPYLSYSYQVGRSLHGPSPTTFALNLRSTPAPSKKRSTVPLSEAYYPTPELRTILGESLPYVDAQLSPAMLDACRVTHKLDAKALVKRLTQLKTEETGTTRQVQGIYRALDERLWDSDSSYIKQAFNQEGLIQLKGVHKGWFKPSEVAWKSNSTFLDSLYPPLQSTYRDFSKFFIDKLGISKELPTEQCVDALTLIGRISNVDERKAEALAIYRRANRELMPKFGREVQTPSWIEMFRDGAVYVDQRGELVLNDDYLFVNDAPGIATLFEDEDDLSFLAIPPHDVPRLSRLLDDAGVARLSDFITVDVLNADEGVADEDLTSRVHRSVHFLARVLYFKRPEVFDEALREGRLASLKMLEVAKVGQVSLIVSIGDYSRETDADIAQSGKRILYRAGARLVKDLLASELSKSLGASTELADAFARILMESDADGIEDYLQVGGIGALPADLLAALDRSSDVESGEQDSGMSDEENPSEGASPTQLDEAVADESDAEQMRGDAYVDLTATLSSSSSPASAVGAPISSGIETQNGPLTAGGNTSSELHPVSSSTPGNTSPFATQSRGDKHGSPNDGTASAGTSSRMNGNPASETDWSSRTGTNSPDTRPSTSGHGSSGRPAPQPSDGLHEPSFGSGPTHSDNFGAKERRKGRRQQPHRTTLGRLLSYAAGPGDDNKQSLDDPEKAAARDATGRAAVEYFMATQGRRWKSLTEMAHNNPGFDIHAISEAGEEEFIEVKGQSGAWTEEGVALTPTELMLAQQKRDKYWLCVVEFAHDDKRRQLYLLRDPYGRTQQFRFDVGWKSAAESLVAIPLKPEKEMLIEMPGFGRGRIMSVREKGKFFNLHVILDDGRQVNKLFNPAKMTLSRGATWQG